MIPVRVAPLSSVCEISMGQAPEGSSYNTNGTGYPLIAGAGDFGETTPSPGKWTDAPTKVSEPGDIILCIRATIGDRNWSDTQYCLGRGVAGLRASRSKLDQKYLWHWLDQSGPALKAKGRGATFLQVSKSDIASLEIPLPPLAEQKRIAKILDAADALRAKRREALAQLDTLVQSIFLDMFGDPVTNPKAWKLAEIGSVVKKCGTWDPKKSGSAFFDYIDLSSIDKNAKLIAAIEKYPSAEAPSRARQLVESGDVLVATVRPNLNGVALVKCQDP